MKVIAIIVGMLGSIIGIYSATSVLVGVGGELA